MSLPNFEQLQSPTAWKLGAGFDTAKKRLDFPCLERGEAGRSGEKEGRGIKVFCTALSLSM